MKKILIPLLVLCMLFMSLSTGYAKEESFLESDEALIKSAIKDYFDNQYEALSQLNEIDLLPASKEIAQTRGLQWTNFQKKENTILGMRIDSYKLERDDLTFNDFSYKLNFKEVSINKDIANVQLLEDSAIRYNQEPSILSEIVNNPHSFKLQLINNEWVIIDHKTYNDYFRDTYEQLSAKGGSPDDIRKDYISSVEKAMKEEVVFNNSNDQNIGSPITFTRATAKYMDRTGAVNFALQYATKTSYNPHSYSYYATDGDCTNFISICLHEGGGICQDTLGGIEKEWYWSSSSNYDSSWTTAMFFRHYIYYNNNSTSSNRGIYGTHASELYMELGDIMSFSRFNQGDSKHTWSVDGRLESTHSAIITKIIPVTSNGVIVGKSLYVCQHSHPAGCKNVPLSTIGYNQPGQRMYLHIVRYYE